MAPPPEEPREKRRRRRPRRRIDLRKALFVLPNLFTVSSIFCGFYAITLCLDAPEPLHLYRAAIAIFFAMFFDMFDGRVARMTRTQSEFGVQLDSLADSLSFGAAPGILLYRWALDEYGFGGLFCSFLYTACASLRLARFNVLAAHQSGPSKHFIGLPTPLAAGTVVALVMATYPFSEPFIGGAQAILGITLGLALLMVSNVHYRTFKDLKPTKKSLSIAFVIVLLFAVISLQLRPAVALAIFFLGYIVLGLVEEVIFFRKRSQERKAPAGDQPHG